MLPSVQGYLLPKVFFIKGRISFKDGFHQFYETIWSTEVLVVVVVVQSHFHVTPNLCYVKLRLSWDSDKNIQKSPTKG